MSLRLVVLHPQASRTGSTRLLAEYLEWQKGNSTKELTVRVWTNLPGPEDSRFRAFKSLAHLKPAYAHSPRWWHRALMRFWWSPFVEPFQARRLRRESRHAHVALVNTVANADALRALPVEIPVVTFVHELELSIARLLSPTKMADLVRRTSVFLVPSQAAADNLCARHGVSARSIVKIRPWLDERRAKIRSSEALQAFRKSVGVTAEQKLVVACGYLDWVKGPDLFLEAAKEISRVLGPDWVRFLWIGSSSDPIGKSFLSAYRRHLGLDDVVTFIDEVEEPSDYFAAADAFALTSRAESFGLAALEAACVGTPVAFFESAGGPSEFLGPPLGRPVSQMSAPAMAEALIELLQQPVPGAARDAQAAHLRETHRVESQGPLIWSALQAAAKSK